MGFAWLLVDQHPRPGQFIGGLLVIAGVAVVKIADTSRGRTDPVLVASSALS